MGKHKTAIIVAGGKGERMQAEVPKQFLILNGKPILMHTLEAFSKYDNAMNIIVVLPESQKSYWKELCESHHFTIKHQIANGGNTRFESVKNGLALTESNTIIAIHDGVRPLVSTHTIARCFEQAAITGSAIPTIDLVDSLRLTSPTGSESVDRSRYKLVQTPQVFDAELLKKAYGQNYSPLFTDDASVVEALGEKVSLVQGNIENIKITNPMDLQIAMALITANNQIV